MSPFFRIGCLVMVLLFGMSACKPAAPAPPPKSQYEDKTLGFHCDVPLDWKINTTETEAKIQSSGDPVTMTLGGGGSMPNLDLFLTVDNQRANYRFEDAGLPLQPGEIYLSFAINRTVSWSSDSIVQDSVGGDLHTLLHPNDPQVPAPGSGQSVFELDFAKRARKWKVTVYLCPPIKPEDLQQLQALLQSLQFADQPVGDSKWAISLALEKLPPAIRTAGPGGQGW
ncbi:MAG TPA: hypothetical protein VK737_01855 [Opitutales bacterium]|jgi:hypothetical protein|nr:hypothetical protein [Opitutales bacterium]